MATKSSVRSVHKNKASERVVSSKRKKDPSVVIARPKQVPQFIVVARYQKGNGGYYTGGCANLFQVDSGHPNSGILMSWRAAEYTRRLLQDRNPSAKYTIHAVRAALQREPKI